ncbi:MAG: hypothetical protein ACLQM6_10830 [Acidobacteriaceae bacterium]
MKKLLSLWQWIIWAAIGLSIAAIVFVACKQHDAAEKYKRHREEYCASLVSDTPNQNKQCREEGKNANDYLPWGYHLVSWPEGITTWAIIATGFILGWQAVLLRKTRDAVNTQAGWMETQAGHMASQIDEAKAQVALLALQNKNSRDRERARLVIRNVEDPEIGAPETILEGRRPMWVHFFVENVGPSKAFNARAQGVVDVVSDPEKALHEDGFFQDFPQIIDEGSEKHRLSLAGFGIEFDEFAANSDFQSIPEELATQIREGKVFIQASGLLTYEDIFGDPHRTPFRLVWKSRGDDDGGRWLTRSTWMDYSPDST